MARIIRRFTVTIPAGTAKTAPLTVDCSFTPSHVVGVEVVIPPGPRGEVGFKIAQSGGQVFPFPPDDYLVTDDEKVKWDIDGANTSGAWQVIAYNTGTFNHTLEIRFLTELTSPADSPGLLNPLPSSVLSG